MSSRASEPSRQKPLRPKSAGTLIIMDGRGGKSRVLMGRRRDDLAFMPGVYVFPGGRLDRQDLFIPSAGELSTRSWALLRAATPAHQGERHLRAVAIAAIREAFEEAGVIVGSPAEAKKALPQAWSAFEERGLLPNLAGLELIARAITPPGRVRRFDTRFFLTSRDKVAAELAIAADARAELLDVNWVDLEDAPKTKTAPVTRLILAELQNALQQREKTGILPPAPLITGGMINTRRRLLTQ